MKILIRDVMQEGSGFDTCLISPALADICTDTTINGTLGSNVGLINCVGIGYTDATQVDIEFSNGIDTITRSITITADAPYQNGLYEIESVYYDIEVEDTLTFDDEDALLDGEVWALNYTPNYNQFTITHNGTYIGRFAMGQYRKLGTSVTKEIGFYTTTESRETLSGQVIPGAGGYYGRTADLDVRYKIDSDIYNDFELAYFYIMKEYPYFLMFDDEQHKMPTNMYRMYMKTNKPLTKLQSSTYAFLYSYKFKFSEAF